MVLLSRQTERTKLLAMASLRIHIQDIPNSYKCSSPTLAGSRFGRVEKHQVKKINS